MICQVSLFSRFLLLLSIPKTQQNSVVSTRLFFRLGKDQKSPSVVPVDPPDFADVETVESSVEGESIDDLTDVAEGSNDLVESPQESLDLVDIGDLTEVDGIEIDWDPLANESLDDLTTSEEIIATQKVLVSNEKSADVLATGADGADGEDGADGADAVVPPEPVAEDIPDSAIDGDDTPTEDTADLEEGDDETIAEESVVGEEEDNSEVVDENPDTEEVAEDIDETEDEDIEKILVEAPVLLSEVTGGLGTVTDPLGKLSIIWKFDGGAYEGQVGVVSTTGMENYDLNSIEFMQEAIRRALANIVVDDTLNGAEFGGWMNGEDSNHGEFTGVQTVQLSAGEQFFLALIPNGTFADVLTGLESGEMPTGSTRPLFSLATANPENTNHFVQLVDLTGKGNIFALEDIRGDEKSDWDLNDIIITIKGAEVDAANLDDLIERGEISEVPKWMEGELGKAILESAIDDLWIESENLVSEKYDFPKEDQPLIGFIDTHFTANNPDLDSSRITFGGDYIENDSNPMVTVGEGTHGDHVLGIVGATQNNGIGINGINDDAPLWVSSAVGSGKWEEALTSFVEAVKASGQPTGVINLSIDLTQVNSDGSITTRYEFTPAERAALELARQNDILIVVSIGNENGVPSVLGQASQEFHNIITVGAAQEVTLPDGTLSYAKADYSNYGDTLDIVAPGGTAANPIISTVGDGVGKMAGTSVATAKVTGAASLIRAANPELNAMQVIEILKKSATDINTLGWDVETGAGLLNIAAAVSLGRITQGEEYKPLQKDIPLVWGETGKPQERAAANASPGSSILISRNNQGVLGNAGGGRPSMSADGNIIAYESYSSDLVSGDTNGKKDIFVFNRSTGQTSRVNVSSSGVQSLDPSPESPVVSANGRFVAFTSNDLNLVPGISGASTGNNVFVRDLVNNTTEIVSLDRWGRASGITTSYPAKNLGISEDGLYVIFSSNSDDLVSGDNNKQKVYSDVFIYDRQLKTTTKVTTSTNGGSQEPTSAYNSAPVISDDGKFAAFIADESFSPTSPGQKNVYIRNLVSGKTSFAGTATGWDLAISGKGERLAFSSPGGFSVYETATGKVRQISNLVGANDFVYGVDISQNGRYATFVSYPLPGVTMSYPMEGVNSVVYRYDLETNEIIAIQTDNSEVPGRYSRNPAISADGRYIVFNSDGTNLAVNDTNGTEDIVFHDTQGIPKPFGLGKVDLVANSFDVAQSTLKKGEPFDVKFKVENKGVSAAKNFQVSFELVNSAKNHKWILDTYTIDNLAGGSSEEITRKIVLPPASDYMWNFYKDNLQLKMVVDDNNSISETDENNIPILKPVTIAADTITFSKPIDIIGSSSIVDTNNGVVVVNGPTASGRLQISDDGSLVTYEYATPLRKYTKSGGIISQQPIIYSDTKTYLQNTVNGQKEEFLNNNYQINTKDAAITFKDYPTFSDDGNVYVRLDSQSLYVYDHITNTKKLVATRPPNKIDFNYQMSSNGRYVVYYSWRNTDGTPDFDRPNVYIYDRVSGTTTVDEKLTQLVYSLYNSHSIEVSFNSVSDDGSKVTIFNQDIQKGKDEILLYDKNTGVIKQALQADSYTGVRSSRTTPDGKFIVFSSEDTNLVANDKNQARDIFIYETATDNIRKAVTGINNSETNGNSYLEDISKDAKYILFSSDATNLIPGDIGGKRFFIHDTSTGKNTLLEVNENGIYTSLGDIREVKISGDGKYVAVIATTWENLGNGYYADENKLFIREWQPKQTLVAGTVDLVGQSFGIPSGATAGDSINAQFQLKNNGTGDTKPFRVGFYLSQDGNISKADKFLGFQSIDSIPANGSTPITSASLGLPLASDPFWNGTGKYYIGMIVDDAEIITETNEINNANQGSTIDLKDISINIPVQGDLSAPGLGLSKSAMNSGEDFKAYLQVANNLANSLDGFRVGFYISDSPNITKNDKLLGIQEIATLAGNSTVPITTDLRLPSGVDSFWKNPGTYYIGAIVDDQNKFNESSEINNVMATPFNYKGTVELAGSYFNIADSVNKVNNSEYYDAGGNIQVQFNIKNDGANQAGPVKVNFQMTNLSKRSQYHSSDPVIGSYIIDSIPGNSSSGLITYNMTLPTDLAIYEGSYSDLYRISMVVDPDNSLSEINEFNNAKLGAGIDSKDIRAWTRKLTEPDLTGNIVSAPTSLKPGDSFNLQYTLSNSGGGAASSFQPNFYLVDLNNPNVGFSLKELSKIPAISLPSNSSSGVQNIQLTLPEVWVPFWQGGSGNYAIQMVADSLDRVTEFNERNNETNYPVQINYIPIFGAFLDKWRQNPSLGLPKGSVEDRGNGIKVQNFANGYIYNDNTGVYVYKTGGAGQGNAKPVDPSYQEKIVPGTTKAIANSGRWIYDGYLNKSQDNLTFRVDNKTNLKFSLNDVDAQLSLFRGSPSNGAFVAEAKFQPSGGYYYADVDLEPGDYTLSTWSKGNASANYQIVTNFTGGITSLVSGKQTISTPSSLPNPGQQINVPVIPLPSSQNIKENWGFLYGRREFQTYYSNGVGSPDWFEFQVDSLTNPKDMHTLQFALRNGNDLDIPNAKIQIVDTNGRVLNVDRPGEVPIAVLPNGKYYVKVTPSQAGMGYKVVMNVDSAKDELLDARDLGKLSGRATFHDFVGSSGDAFGDTYRFQVEKDSFVRFKVNTKDAGGDADITLMNSSGQVLVQGNGDNYGERQLGAGTYFLKVVPTLGRTNYELVTQVAETLGEMYGRREEFPGKSISSGYADAFYSFNLAKQTDLSMALKNLSADVDFELRRDNGTGLVDSTFIASNDGVDQFGVANELKYYRDLAAGKYFVRVINKNNVSSAKYDLVLNGSSNITQENIGLLNGKKEYSAYVGNASSQRSYTFTVNQAMKVKFSLNKPSNNSSDNMINGNLKLINADTGADINLVNSRKDGSINYAEAELKPGINYKLIVTPSDGGTNYKLVVDPVIPAPITGSANLIKLFKGELTGQYIDVDNFEGPQCWDLVAYVTGQRGSTKEWKRGTNVMSSGNIQIGTSIATFLGPNGAYDNPVKVNEEITYIQHTGIFAGYGVENGVSGFYIWDQNWSRAPIQKHFIKTGGSGTSNANNYFAIQYPTQGTITLPPGNPTNIGIGDGLDTEAKKAIFQAAYKARISDKKVDRVNAISPAFRWANGWIQEFQRDNHKFVITLRDGSPEAFWLIGDNRQEYDQLSAKNINLGYARSNETPVNNRPDATMQTFATEDGRISRIYHSPKTGSVAVWGDIGAKYDNLDGPNSWLGLPTKHEYSVNGTTFADFENGQIASKDGKTEVLKPGEKPSWSEKPLLPQKHLHADYEQLIWAVYDYGTSKQSSADQTFSKLGYKVDKVFDDGSTGFYAVGLVSTIGRPPVLAIRGTGDPLDFLDDLNPISIGFGQSVASKNEVEQWLKGIKGNQNNPFKSLPDVTGHSLGGALTQLIAADFTSSIGQVVTFNSPGVAAWEPLRFINNGGSPSNVTHYIVSGDLVSMGGASYLPGKVFMQSYSDYKINPFDAMNPISEHLIGSLKPLLDSKTNLPDFKMVDSLSDGSLSSPLFHYSDPDYLVFLLVLNELSPGLALTLLTRAGTEALRTGTGAIVGVLGIQAAIQLIKQAIELGKSLWATGTQWLSYAWNAASQWAQTAWETITDWATNAFKVMAKWGQDAWNAATKWRSDAWEATAKWSSDAWNATKDWSSDAWEATKNWSSDAWNATTQWSSDAWNATKDWSADTWKKTANWTTDTWNKGINWTKGVIDWMIFW